MKLSTKLFISTALTTLTACGGGGGSDNSGSSSTTVQQNVSMAAMQTTTQTITANSITANLPGIPRGMGMNNISVSAGSMVPSVQVERSVNVLLAQAQLDNSSINLLDNGNRTIPGTCGGQADITSTVTTPDDPAVQFPLSVVVNVNFQQFCIDDDFDEDDYDYELGQYDDENDGDESNDDVDDSITINGTVSFNANFAQETDGSATLVYDISYSIIDDDDVYMDAISLTQTCMTNAAGTQCDNAFSSAVGGDNYTLNGITVTGDDNSGYSVSGMLTDDDGDAYTVVVSGLTQCSNGNIATGNIQLTDSDGEMTTVTFPGCDDYVVTYQGMATTYSQ